MTTLVPRPPYSKEELDELYPKGLKLQLVQVVSRNTFIRFQTCCVADLPWLWLSVSLFEIVSERSRKK